MTGGERQTVLVTGIAMDALRGRRPNYYKAARHWSEGANKAAVYSGLFMAILQLAGVVVYNPTTAGLLQRYPLPPVRIVHSACVRAAKP